ncbi:MAG: hypothetical protein JNM34_11930 [Chthonomonadaceae bacterium]|nr:hypothetical protein [Chthonomonadaceae bacterium]
MKHLVMVALATLTVCLASAQDNFDVDLWKFIDTGVFTEDIRVEPGGLSLGQAVTTHVSWLDSQHTAELRSGAYWFNAALTKLARLEANKDTNARDVDENGLIVGSAKETVSGQVYLRPVYWTDKNSTPTKKLPSGSYQEGELLAMNDWVLNSLHKMAVGYVIDLESGLVKPYCYDHSNDTKNLLPLPSGVSVGKALSVNDDGKIVGYGTYSEGDKPLLWTPSYNSGNNTYSWSVAILPGWIAASSTRTGQAVSIDNEGNVTGSGFSPSEAFVWESTTQAPEFTPSLTSGIYDGGNLFHAGEYNGYPYVFDHNAVDPIFVFRDVRGISTPGSPNAASIVKLDRAPVAEELLCTATDGIPRVYFCPLARTRAFLPASYQIVSGDNVTGNNLSLFNVFAGDFFQVQVNVNVPNANSDPVEVVLNGTADVTGELTFRVSGKMSSGGVYTHSIDLWDWTLNSGAGGWSTTYTRSDTLGSTVKSFDVRVIGSDVTNKIVRGSDHAVKARYRVKAVIAPITNWKSQVDWALWLNPDE